MDRLTLLLGPVVREAHQGRPDLFVIPLDAAARDEALTLVSTLRREGLAVETDTRGGSLKSQMKRADKSRARYALVLGETELRDRRAQLKPMAGGEPLEVGLSELARTLKA